MRELRTINYIQNEVTKQNKAIYIYIYNQKINLNQREGNNPNIRDVRIMGIGHLRK